MWHMRKAKTKAIWHKNSTKICGFYSIPLSLLKILVTSDKMRRVPWVNIIFDNVIRKLNTFQRFAERWARHDPLLRRGTRWGCRRQRRTSGLTSPPRISSCFPRGRKPLPFGGTVCCYRHNRQPHTPIKVKGLSIEHCSDSVRMSTVGIVLCSRILAG